MKKRKPDLYRKLNDEFGRCLAGAFLSTFGMAVETNWSIVSNVKITMRVDGRPLNLKQRFFIATYENGYFQAAHEASNGN